VHIGGPDVGNAAIVPHDANGGLYCQAGKLAINLRNRAMALIRNEAGERNGNNKR